MYGYLGHRYQDIIQLRSEGSLGNIEVIWHTDLILGNIDIDSQQLRSEPRFIFALSYQKSRDGGNRRVLNTVGISLPHVLPRTIIPGIVDCINALGPSGYVFPEYVLEVTRCAFGPGARVRYESRPVGVLPEHTPPRESLASPSWYFVLDFAAETKYGLHPEPATITGGFAYTSPNFSDAPEMEVLDADQFLVRLSSDENNAIDPRWVDALKSKLPTLINPIVASEILRKVA